MINKKVLITGGASGIGRETVIAFTRLGADVTFVDINGKLGNELRQSLSSEGYKVDYKLLDVTSEEQIKKLFSQLEDIDVLVNNVGIEIATPFHDMTLVEWNKLLNVNLTSMFLCCKYALQRMMKKEVTNSIINVCSVSGVVAWPNIAAYNTTKGGVMMLTKSLAVDYAKYNIRVNCVCPSIVDTPMTDLSIGEKNLKKIKEEKSKLVPLGRMCQPSDVANSIIFLASDNSTFITGTPLLVDGGYTAI